MIVMPTKKDIQFVFICIAIILVTLILFIMEVSV